MPDDVTPKKGNHMHKGYLRDLASLAKKRLARLRPDDRHQRLQALMAESDSRLKRLMAADRQRNATSLQEAIEIRRYYGHSARYWDDQVGRHGFDMPMSLPLQINLLGSPPPERKLNGYKPFRNLYDPAIIAREAAKQAANKWRPWTTFKSGSYKPKLTNRVYDADTDNSNNT